MNRKNLPAGVFFAHTNPHKDLAGQRFGDVTAVRKAASSGNWWVRCDVGHDTLKGRSYLTKSARGTLDNVVRCAECTRLAREAVAAE